MNDKEVKEQINSDYDEFLNKPYSGHISIPENIIEVFKKCIMALPPFAHQINFNKIKSIATKDVKALTYSDLQCIIKVVLNTPLEKLYDNFFVAIPEHIKIEKFIISYNAAIDDFQKSLESKSKMLKNLSSGVLGKNGMRIIPHGNA